MARREIGTRWDRENRNNINENFKELYDVQDRAIEEATQSIIDSAKLIWLEPVNTYADIATTYPNPEVGHTVFVRDTGKVYRFYDGAWLEIQQIDAGPVNEVDTRLSAEIEENRQEIEQARTKADGTTFPVLRDRLNDVDDKIGILSNVNVNIENFPIQIPEVNDTARIKRAIDFVKNSDTVKTIKFPEKVYNVDVPLNGAAFYIPKGVTIEGSGYNTEFRINPNSFTGNGYARLFYCEGGTTFRNFRINGQKDLVDRTGITSLDCCGIYCAENNNSKSRVVFDTIWVHDLIGVNKESFGVMSKGGYDHVIFKNVIGWNIEGTPIHVAGGYPHANMSADNVTVKNVTVINCEGYSNTWQGLSVYGAENVKIYDSYMHDNAQNGFNFEWCVNVDLIGGVAHDNGFGGIGTWGRANLRAYNVTIYNNAKADVSSYGELNFRVGSWYKMNDLGVTPKANIGTVEIHNCVVKPQTGGCHILMSIADTVTEGDLYPDKLVLNVPDVKDWVVRTRESSGSIKNKAYTPNVEIKNLEISKPVSIGKLLSDYSSSGSITATAYAGGGNLSPNAVQLNSTVQYSNWRTKYVLKANRSYLVKGRVKILDSSDWRLLNRNSNDNNPFSSVIFNAGGITVGNWYKFEAIFTTDNSDERLQIQCNSPSGSIVVDYLDVYELVSGYDQSIEKTMPEGYKTGVQSGWTYYDVTIETQPDTNYGVIVTPEWNAGAVWVTNKTTTGFRVNWTTNPSSTSGFAWKLVR